MGRSAFNYHSAKLQVSNTFACLCCPNYMNYSMGLIGIIEMDKTRMSAVGSHKKLTCHVAKLKAWPFDCGLKPPTVQRDRLSV